MARRYGASDLELDTLGDLAASPLAEPEKEAVRFAEKMTTAHATIGDDDVARLRGHWRDDQVVELLTVVGLFNYLNRFAEALALDPTRPGEGGPEPTEDGTEGEG